MTETDEKIIHIPPQNLEAEVSLLGAILLDKEAIIKVADIVSANDFYKGAHQIIFEAMLSLYEKREPIDIITLTNELDEKKETRTNWRLYLYHIAGQLRSIGGSCHQLCQDCS